MKRKQKLNRITDQGWWAGYNGVSIDSGDYHGELERAAFEIGWRSGKAEQQKLIEDVTSAPLGVQMLLGRKP